MITHHSLTCRSNRTFLHVLLLRNFVDHLKSRNYNVCGVYVLDSHVNVIFFLPFLFWMDIFLCHVHDNYTLKSFFNHTEKVYNYSEMIIKLVSAIFFFYITLRNCAITSENDCYVDVLADFEFSPWTFIIKKIPTLNFLNSMQLSRWLHIYVGISDNIV